jgi:hypothetical protein
VKAASQAQHDEASCSDGPLRRRVTSTLSKIFKKDNRLKRCVGDAQKDWELVAVSGGQTHPTAIERAQDLASAMGKMTETSS